MVVFNVRYDGWLMKETQFLIEIYCFLVFDSKFNIPYSCFTKWEHIHRILAGHICEKYALYVNYSRHMLPQNESASFYGQTISKHINNF